MVDLLKRSQAPITDQAWEEINSTAKQTLKAFLLARTLVGFNGPHGWDFAAINTGRLDIPKKEPSDGVHWGKRLVQPLIELRVPFHLNQMEIDSISRGVDDADLSSLEDAAKTIAQFEDKAIFKGFKDGGIEGISKASSHKPIKLPEAVNQFPQLIMEGVQAIKLSGIEGPYSLILNQKLYESLYQQDSKPGYPIHRVIRDLLGGSLLWSPMIDGGLLLSTRGGDFEMTVGQDLSIGYTSHNRDKVELYFTESFTFRVIESAAAVVYTTK